MSSDGTSYRHKNSLSYVETEVDAPADGQFRATWDPDGRTVVITGPCPACGGRTASEFSPGMGGTKGFLRAKPYPRTLPSPVTVFCECGYVHADRPADALDKGCGRFWPTFLPDNQRQPPSEGSAGTSPVQAAP